MPLADIRVLDLTNVLAGPFCCYQMALMGADVVKVEVPGRGDLARELGSDPERNKAKMGASFVAQNAGKRSISLDLKAEAGKEIFTRLVQSADIVVENFRPGVMERLGFGWPKLKSIKPQIVYGAISGFGQNGPMANNPAYDQIVQGLAGAMSITGDQHSAPLRVGFPVADTIGGMTAAFAITAALVRAKSTGEGEFVDVSMLESTLAAMGWAVSNWLLDQDAAKPMGNENQTASPSATYKTAKGPLNIAANKQEQFETLCRLIGRPDLIEHHLFRDREDRKKNRFALNRVLENGLSSDTAKNWARKLNDHGVPAGEVLSVPEILAHPQIQERCFVHRFDDHIAVATGGYSLAQGRPKPNCPPPTLGADTRAILHELGYSETEIATFKSLKAV